MGRARDAILRDGVIVPVTELEAVIAGHPKVSEAALVGLPGQNGETICAVLVLNGDEPPSLNDLHEHLREAGRHQRFWPDRIEVLDALPKTLTGKVRKAELRERYA
ncbi:hypothetical protein GCM10010116_55180 [Microbispora rosea subsp. aerata]|nr:hypothetical protein GCM10010116_55180 [Microbispora rosea subsp. aerata]GIH58583.1 hypothetical protein Mro02_54970 [Microbispora rosea subsp. aerata]GLJ85324.1 hypothetical protein GCM10017588_40530 [Microbispora rosea subsp. aerata]